MPHSPFFVPLKKECPCAVSNEAWLFIAILHQAWRCKLHISPEGRKEIDRLCLSKELPLLCAYGWKV